MYIHQMPYNERRQLCVILDRNELWVELGIKHMQYDEDTIEKLKRFISMGPMGRSPSCELLHLWSHQNHTVDELFILLHRMGLYNGMYLIKDLVEDKYHKLFNVDHLTGLLSSELKKLRIPDSKVPSVDFDNTTKETLNKDCGLDNGVSSECNESGIVGRLLNGPVDNALSPTQNQQLDSNKMLTAHVVQSAGATPLIPYEDLEVATQNWSTSRVLGQGGFGTVFRGTWKCTQVAIKRLETKLNSKKDLTEQIRQSITELHCLNTYRHDNILPLYGYSIGGPYPCLIYQYMSGGSLDSRIRTNDIRKLLNWPKRLTVAIGTARGLQFLHTTLHNNKPLIHGDIKSANILLDPMDHPRIGDFGLAREGPDNNYTHIKVSRIQGTLPYLPDDFLRSRHFSTKVDTYSFGMVLFELATAMSASNRKTIFLKDQVINHPPDRIFELKDNRVPGYDCIFSELIRIGKNCVEKRAKDRPEMVQVLLMLEEVAKMKSESGKSNDGCLEDS